MPRRSAEQKEGYKDTMNIKKNTRGSRILQFLKDPTGLKRSQRRHTEIIRGMNAKHAVVMRHFTIVKTAVEVGSPEDVRVAYDNLLAAQKDYAEFIKPLYHG